MEKQMMKLKLGIFIIFAGLIIQETKADDVYNFYFQKSGESGAKVTKTEEPKAVPVASPSATPSNSPPTPSENQIKTKADEVKASPVESSLRHWQLSFGKSNFSATPAEFQDANGPRGYGDSTISGQWAIGVQYNFTNSFGLSTQLLQLQDRPLKFDGVTNFDFAAGLIFTPFHIALFDWSTLNIGFIGGYITVPSGYSFNYEYATYYYSDLADHHTGTYYAGAQASLDLGKSVSLIGMTKVLPAMKTTHVTAGVAFNF